MKQELNEKHCFFSCIDSLIEKLTGKHDCFHNIVPTFCIKREEFPSCLGLNHTLISRMKSKYKMVVVLPIRIV